jgi:hypothetical protein
MILIILMVLAWWFFSKKKYYVRIESVGEDVAAQEQILKIELETTLRRAMEITKKSPYLVNAGGFFSARSLVKKLEANGGTAKLEFHWVWSKPQEGPVAE